ncbi:S8 family serine peptidase [Carnobacterium maltaromaticum]|uniref:S8 family serine peptidase n=1 Tax=Carnobacterium maltaromaticum TaxID=2751 RepID=UPI0039BDA448
MMKKKKFQNLIKWILIYTIIGGVGSQFSPIISSAIEAENLSSDNYTKLVKALESNEQSVNALNEKAFDENIAAQLEIKRLKFEEFSDAEKNEQEIRVVIQLLNESASDTAQPPTGTKKSIEKIEQATDDVIQNQQIIKTKVEKITGNKAQRSFGYLLNGFSMDVKYKDIETIRNLPGVADVTVATVYHPTSVEANQLANINHVWEEYQLKGEGMVVSIIDTGIDPTHRDLRLSDTTKEKITLEESQTNIAEMGHGKAFTRKIPYGYNYADNNTTIIDENPTTNMHGMHVAGIAAANGIGADSTTAVLGVAPEAQLLAMKVFSNSSGAVALNDDVIAAIEDSVKLGADILNMSLGSVAGNRDRNDPVQISIREAAEVGVLSVIAAGNSGLSTSNDTNVAPQNKFGTIDTGTLGSPGVTDEGLTVASLESSVQISGRLAIYTVNEAGAKVPYLMETPAPSEGKIPYFKGVTANITGLSTPHAMIDLGTGTEADYQNKDVAGKIVLVRRGSIPFLDKQVLAKKYGAAAVFIYNNLPNLAALEMPIADPNFITLGLTKEDGDKFAELISQNPAINYSFEADKFLTENPKAGKISDFSSWGPTPSLEFKPEITAPGGQIYSTANQNSYQTNSGTSMAAPFVAGTEALIYQALKAEQSPLKGLNLIEFAKASLLNTAIPVMDQNHSDVIISPRRQGAGLLQADQAIKNKVYLTDAKTGKASIALKQINQSTKISLQLKNAGKQDVSYNFHDFGGVYTEDRTATAEVYEKKIDGADIKIASSEIKLKAGETKTIQLTLDLPDTFSKNQFVEGYIGLASETQPDLVIPYMGFYGDYSEAAILDTPVYSGNSIQGKGFFTDKSNTFLGLEKGTINPNLVAISPNKDGRKDEAKPTLYFLRHAKTVTYEIVDSNKKVIRRLNEDHNVIKDYFNPASSAFTAHTITAATWNGMIYNPKTGGNDVVPDGHYQMKITVQGMSEKAGTQETFLPIKVDTKNPVISQAKFITPDSLSLKIEDQLSGADLRSVAIAVNGQIETYDLSATENEELTVPLKNTQQAANGKNQVEVVVSDYAGNIGHFNEFISFGTKEEFFLFNLSDNALITTTSNSYSTEKKSYTVKGYYPAGKSIYVNGSLIDNQAGYFDMEVPLTENSTELIFSQEANQQTIIKRVAIRAKVTPPELTIDSPTESVVIDENHYLVTGKTGSSTKVLEVVNQSNGVKINSTDAIQADGQFSTEISLVNGQNSLMVTALDEFGNKTIKIISLRTTGYNQPTILALSNLNVVGFTQVGVGNPNYDEISKEYTIKGRLKEPVEQFTIDGKDVAYDPIELTFSYPVPLKQGKNTVAFYLQDSAINAEKPLVDEGYTLLLDTVLPTLDVENLQTDSQGNYQIYTNQNPFLLKGLISDNFSGYRLYINNENVLTDANYFIFDEKFFANRLAAPFEYPVNVTEGENSVQIGLLDTLNNLTKKAISIYYRQTSPLAPIVAADTTSLTNKAVNLTATSEAETLIYYCLSGEEYQLYTDQIAVTSNQKVSFKTLDKYGNYSEPTIYEVKNSQQVIASQPKIDVSPREKLTEAVQISLGYQKELTEREQTFTHLRYSLDNGLTYSEYKAPFKLEKSVDIYAQSYDDAGNQSEIIKETVLFEEIVEEKEKPETETTNPTIPILKPGQEEVNSIIESTKVKESATNLVQPTMANELNDKDQLPKTGIDVKQSYSILGLWISFYSIYLLLKNKKKSSNL